MRVDSFGTEGTQAHRCVSISWSPSSAVSCLHGDGDGKWSESCSAGAAPRMLCRSIKEHVLLLTMSVGGRCIVWNRQERHFLDGRLRPVHSSTGQSLSKLVCSYVLGERMRCDEPESGTNAKLSGTGRISSRRWLECVPMLSYNWAVTWN